MSEAESRSCLFCGASTAGSRSESHIWPASMGNTLEHLGEEPLVLPPGHVCDTCNNRFGSTVEANFLNNDIGMTARFWGVPNRRGNYPSVLAPRGSTATVNDGPTQRLKSFRIRPSAHRPRPGTGSKTRLNHTIKFNFHHHLTSALLSKMFIEYTAFCMGYDAATRAELDCHRNNALASSKRQWLPYYRCAGTRWRQVHLELGRQAEYFALEVGPVRLLALGEALLGQHLPDVPGCVLHSPDGDRGIFGAVNVSVSTGIGEE